MRREASAPLELEELDGNEAARAVYESVAFVVDKTTTGKLAGNESLQATGHTMRWKPSDWETVVDASVSAAAPTTSLVSFRRYCAESVLQDIVKNATVGATTTTRPATKNTSAVSPASGIARGDGGDGGIHKNLAECAGTDIVQGRCPSASTLSLFRGLRAPASV